MEKCHLANNLLWSHSHREARDQSHSSVPLRKCPRSAVHAGVPVHNWYRYSIVVGQGGQRNRTAEYILLEQVLPKDFGWGGEGDKLANWLAVLNNFILSIIENKFLQELSRLQES